MHAPANIKTATREHVAELDSLRTLAVLTVMCAHWLPADHPLRWFLSFGTPGVMLFFVLSGYLITGILLGCRTRIESGELRPARALRQFYIRRGLRIFPLFYLVLFTTAALNVTGVREQLPWHAVYASNFYLAFRGPPNGPSGIFWTLAVEEQFYLFWPLLILLLPGRLVFRVVLTVVGVGVVCRVGAFAARGLYQVLLPACMPYLGLGALLAVCEHEQYGSPAARLGLMRACAATTVGLCLVALLARLIDPHPAGQSSWVVGPGLSGLVIASAIQLALMTGFTWLIGWAVTGGDNIVRQFLRLLPLVYLGRISYGLYIYHTNALAIFSPLMSAGVVRRIESSFWLQFLLTVAVASVSWFVFENPINRLKRFFPYAWPPADLVAR